MNNNLSQLSKATVLNVERPLVEETYNRFFVPDTNPTWRSDEDNFSLDQPSPLKFVPSETTYGIESLLCRKSNG